MAEVIVWVVDETRESSSAEAVGGGSWIREVEAASKAEVKKGRQRRERVNLGGAASGTSGDQRLQKVVVCSNGEANGEVISVEFEERIFGLNPACLRRREDSIQIGGMNFIGGRDTYEGGLFWEGRRRSRASLEKSVDLPTSCVGNVALGVEKPFGVEVSRKDDPVSLREEQ
jgi:hypothetical protein